MSKVIEHIVNAIGIVIIMPVLAIVVTIDVLVNQNEDE